MAYGCWCLFDDIQINQAGRGRGPPVDRWDDNCRSLQQGYECALMDADARGEPCVPWEQDYPSLGAGTHDSIVPTVFLNANVSL